MQDRYRLIEVKGQGSFGIVFRAFDEQRKQDVAIKFAKANRPEDIALLEHEINVLNRIDHRHIVRLLDHDIQCRHPHIVLELCDRGSLRNWIGQIRWPALASVFDQAARGLHSFHVCGGFHGDIKPDNLLLKSSWMNAFEVKIADFGTAQVPHVGMAMDRSPRGTRGYIAREVLEGKPFISAADVYSLGIVITELATGGHDPARLRKSNLPSEFCKLVQSMTCVCPASRPTAQDISAELEKIKRLRLVIPTALRLEIS